MPALQRQSALYGDSQSVYPHFHGSYRGSLQIAPSIIQSYGISFLLLPLNIFSTYYFQAVMKPQAAFVVSVSRGLVISGILILLLPALVGADALWFAMPITELFTAVYAVVMMRNYTRKLAG